MNFEMEEYIESNKSYILKDIVLNNSVNETIVLNYYTEFINLSHALDSNKGFTDDPTKKYIKKFVLSDFNSLYLLFQQKLNEMYYELYNEDDIYKKKQEQLTALLKIKTYEQRSPEWYEFRRHILTASDLATSFDKGHFNSRNDLIMGKMNPKPFTSNPACEWGVKYEDVAIQLYERRNNAKDIEFGLVPHPTIKIFGASPDGIVADVCDDTGNTLLTARMLEIKCPWKRKIIHGEVPWHYWAQIQGQLDTCDLDLCDFLQVQILEYKSRKAYWEDTETTEKGSVVSTWDINQEHTGSPKYHFSDIGLSKEDEDKWTEQFFDEEKYTIHNITHWHVGTYSCYTVKRDKPWFNSIIPEIYRFHEDLNDWKEKGVEELQKYIDSKKRKKKVSDNNVPEELPDKFVVPQDICMI